jgi:F-type H+-transporting ATPase subunit alpha
MAAFAQFASDLDAKTRAQLERGKRLVEVLKQGQYVPQSVERQILIIYAATKGHVDELPVESLARYEAELNAFVDTKFPDLLPKIVKKKELTDEITAELDKAIKAFGEVFVADASQKASAK